MRNDWFEDDNEIRLLRRGKRRLLDIVFAMNVHRSRLPRCFCQ